MGNKVSFFTQEKYKRGVYEKTVLFIYPHIKKMAEALETKMEIKARLSYRFYANVEKLVDELLTYGWQIRFLLHTYKEITSILKNFSTEELFLLEYRYFRRRKKLMEYEKAQIKMSLRTFYRRQERVLKKFSAMLKKKNMDELWFAENFSGMDWVMTVYKKVYKGNNSLILGKYRKSPFFRKEEWEDAGQERLPLSV